MTLHPCFQPASPLLPIPTPLQLYSYSPRISLATVRYVQRSSAYRLIGCFVPFGSRGSSARKSERRRQLSLYTCPVRRIQYYYYYSYCRFIYFLGFCLDNIFHFDVHCVCMLVQRFEQQGSVGALQISIIYLSI